MQDPHRKVALCTKALEAKGLPTGTRYQLLLHRGIAYGNLKNFEKAGADFDAAIALKPKDAHGFAFRSTYLAQKGDPAGAMNDATRAVALDDELALAVVARATANYVQGKYDDAIADAERAMKLNAKTSEPWNIRGLARTKKRDFAGAIADHKRAIELKPGSPVLYENLGLAHVASKDFAAAVADYSKAFDLNGRRIQPLVLRGQAKRQMGDTAGAKEDFERASKMDVANAEDEKAIGIARQMLAALNFSTTEPFKMGVRQPQIVPPPPQPAAVPTSKPKEAAEPVKPVPDTPNDVSKKVVIAGTNTRLHYWYSLNTDCTPVGKVTVLTISPPKHGVLEAADSMATPHFPATNVRSACNSKEVPVQAIFYTPDAAYSGPDSFTVDVIFPGGNARKQSVTIDVRAPKGEGLVERIPITSRDRVFVKVSINGVEGDFLLDTGASMVSMNNDFAKKAKVLYDETRKGSASTANGPAEFHSGIAGSIKLGSLEANNVSVMVKPEGAPDFGSGRYAGLLGMTFLSRFNMHMSDTEVRLSKRD